MLSVAVAVPGTAASQHHSADQAVCAAETVEERYPPAIASGWGVTDHFRSPMPA